MYMVLQRHSRWTMKSKNFRWWATNYFVWTSFHRKNLPSWRPGKRHQPGLNNHGNFQKSRQHRQCRASEHRAEHSEILQDTGVYSNNRTSNIVRLFAKLVYWHRFHTRAPRVSPVTSFKLSSIELSCVGFDSAWYLFCVADSHMDKGMKFGTLYKYKARCVPWTRLLRPGWCLLPGLQLGRFFRWKLVHAD